MEKNVDVLESQWITKPTKATTSSQKQNIHVIDFSKSKHSEDSIILYTKENATKVSFHFLINWKMKFKCLIVDFYFHTKLEK